MHRARADRRIKNLDKRLRQRVQPSSATSPAPARRAIGIRNSNCPAWSAAGRTPPSDFKENLCAGDRPAGEIDPISVPLNRPFTRPHPAEDANGGADSSSL